MGSRNKLWHSTAGSEGHQSQHSRLLFLITLEIAESPGSSAFWNVLSLTHHTDPGSVCLQECVAEEASSHVILREEPAPMEPFRAAPFSEPRAGISQDFLPDRESWQLAMQAACPRSAGELMSPATSPGPDGAQVQNAGGAGGTSPKHWGNKRRQIELLTRRIRGLRPS